MLLPPLKVRNMTQSPDIEVWLEATRSRIKPLHIRLATTNSPSGTPTQFTRDGTRLRSAKLMITLIMPKIFKLTKFERIRSEQRKIIKKETKRPELGEQEEQIGVEWRGTRDREKERQAGSETLSWGWSIARWGQMGGREKEKNEGSAKTRWSDSLNFP